jgi:hypothetical protein
VSGHGVPCYFKRPSKAFKITTVPTQTLFIKRLCLPFMAMLMVLLALGPFLHAHYGGSRMLGFHVDGIVQATGVAHHFDLASLSQDTEEESAAVGVTTSYARQTLQDSDGDTSANFVAMALVLFAVAAYGFWVQRRNGQSTWLSPSTYALGFPPPAHAPPAFNI